jgi:hypothetical protein
MHRRSAADGGKFERSARQFDVRAGHNASGVLEQVPSIGRARLERRTTARGARQAAAADFDAVGVGKVPRAAWLAAGSTARFYRTGRYDATKTAGMGLPALSGGGAAAAVIASPAAAAAGNSHRKSVALAPQALR